MAWNARDKRLVAAFAYPGEGKTRTVLGHARPSIEPPPEMQKIWRPVDDHDGAAGIGAVWQPRPPVEALHAPGERMVALP
jgi:hypothetical protein